MGAFHGHGVDASLHQFSGVIAEPPRHLREELASFGLLAAQVMMAAAHVRDGEGIDKTDRDVLIRSAEIFRFVAARIRFVQSGGQGQEPPAMFLSAGAANDVVLSDQSPADPEQIARVYDEMAEKLESLAASKSTAEEAAEVYDLFRVVAERARAGAGSSGHEPLPQSSPGF